MSIVWIELIAAVFRKLFSVFSVSFPVIRYSCFLTDGVSARVRVPEWVSATGEQKRNVRRKMERTVCVNKFTFARGVRLPFPYWISPLLSAIFAPAEEGNAVNARTEQKWKSEWHSARSDFAGFFKPNFVVWVFLLAENECLCGGCSPSCKVLTSDRNITTATIDTRLNYGYERRIALTTSIKMEMHVPTVYAFCFLFSVCFSPLSSPLSCSKWLRATEWFPLFLFLQIESAVITCTAGDVMLAKINKQ